MNFEERIENDKYLRAKKRVKSIRGFYTHLMVYLVINISVSIINMLLNFDIDDRETFFQALTHFGTYINWVFWGIGLFIHGLNVFWLKSSYFKNWEDRKVKEYMDQEAVEKNNRYE